MRLTLPQWCWLYLPSSYSYLTRRRDARPTRRGSMGRRQLFFSPPALLDRPTKCCFARPLGLPQAIDICIEFQPAGEGPPFLPLMAPLAGATVVL